MDEAIARMEAIAAALPATDGLACFNRMYLGVTRDVAARIGQNFFANPTFMSRLDVVFANLYFDAVNALTITPNDLPTAWLPLLQDRSNTGIEPIQFALAGMNAHINHDLPLAVVNTCAALGSAPEEGTHHDDYRKVDQLLAAAEESARQSFETGLILEVDRHLEAVANIVANWDITTARDAAWDASLALWATRDIGFARDILLHSLTRSVVMTSRFLLAVV